MPSASTVGDAVLPHGCWSGGNISEGSTNVLINGRAASSVGDSGTPHSWICGSPSQPPHPVIVSEGSRSVLINGKAAAYIGSATQCGSTVSSGSMDVIVGI